MTLMCSPNVYLTKTIEYREIWSSIGNDSAIYKVARVRDSAITPTSAAGTCAGSRGVPLTGGSGRLGRRLDRHAERRHDPQSRAIAAPFSRLAAARRLKLHTALVMDRQLKSEMQRRCV